MCKSICEAVLAVILIVFALWQTAYSQWIIIIVAVILLIHSFTCKRCFASPAPIKETRKSKK